MRKERAHRVDAISLRRRPVAATADYDEVVAAEVEFVAEPIAVAAAAAMARSAIAVASVAAAVVAAAAA